VREALTAVVMLYISIQRYRVRLRVRLPGHMSTCISSAHLNRHERMIWMNPARFEKAREGSRV
jgi:hypothetical protein